MASAENKAWSILKFFSTRLDDKDEDSELSSAELSLWKKKIDRYYRFFSHTAVCYVYEGDFLLTVGGKTYTATAGDLYIIRRGVEWSCHFHGEAPVKVLSVAFSGPLSHTMIQSYLGESDIFFAQSGCRGLSDRLLEAGERKTIGSRELFDEFMLFLLRICQRLSASRAEEDEATLSRRIRLHILRYGMNGKLSVKNIAEAFSIRVQDLQLLWKSCYGMTVHHYIQEMRLAKAAELLAFSNVSISQIAEETGYADRCYLDKLFLKKYGVTPSVYRKSHGWTE